MFHKIAHMYSDITKQETVQASVIFQDLLVNFESTKATGTSTTTPILSMPLKPSMPIYQKTVTAVTEDLEEIQPRTSQVWNFEK